MGIFTGNQKIRTFNELKYFRNAKLTYGTNAFMDCISLEEVTMTDELGRGVTCNDQNIFTGCPLKKYSGAVNHGYIFKKTTSPEIDLSESFVKATNLTRLFQYSRYESIDISHWDTTGVVLMEGVFETNYSYVCLTSLKLPPNFITPSVETTKQMFLYQKLLTTIDTSGWDTSNVTTMYHMFSNCEKLATLDVSNINVSNATNLARMFNACNSLTSLDVSGWDTSKVQNFEGIFYAMNALVSIDLSSFDTISATTMANIFGTGNAGNGSDSCIKLTSIIISDKFFNCITRSDSPISAINFKGACAWVDVQQITDILNLLPDLTSLTNGVTTATLYLSTKTKTAINNDTNASFIRDAKALQGWTFA